MIHKKFETWMLNGHPGNVTQAVKRGIVRGINAGLVVTATTDGHHAPGSWHYTKLPFRRKGHAVDMAPPLSVPHAERLRRMREFQAHEYAMRGDRRFRELIGPTNNRCILNRRSVVLANNSALEEQHDNHVHQAF